MGISIETILNIDRVPNTSLKDDWTYDGFDENGKSKNSPDFKRNRS